MKYQSIFYFVFLCLYFSACTVKPWQQETPSEFLQLPIAKDNENFDLKEKKDQEKRVEIFLSPEQLEEGTEKDYTPQKDSAILELTDKNILMEVISYWDDGSSYKMVVQFINPTGEGINLNLNLYAYNKIGKLIRTQFSGIYFRPFSAMTQEFSFTKRGNEVRWLINLTGKK
ncbi:MAG: hypothetical protein HUU50_20845 [Candidatus Brocadiae bacterium]|nr:hypothetical protein [Candidatus Brocadiia bacterium]